jgi:hypothetical protein
MILSKYIQFDDPHQSLVTTVILQLPVFRVLAAIGEEKTVGFATLVSFSFGLEKRLRTPNETRTGSREESEFVEKNDLERCLSRIC